MKHFILMILAVSLLAMPLSACGKKGNPKPPGTSSYPNTYPSPSE